MQFGHEIQDKKQNMIFVGAWYNEMLLRMLILKLYIIVIVSKAVHVILRNLSDPVAVAFGGAHLRF
jgi:hypothetical protein